MQNGYRSVYVYERWADQPQPTPNTVGTSQPFGTAVLGDWKAADTHTNAPFILRFDDTGQGTLMFPSPILVGSYTWTTDTTMQVTLSNTRPKRAGQLEMCVGLPAFLSDLCQSTTRHPVIPQPPVAYPGVDVVPPTDTATSGYPPPPTPTDEIISQVDAIFTVTRDGNRLTLTTTSGKTQTLQRVTSK